MGDARSYLIIWNAIKDNLAELVVHTYANHIIQRCLQVMPLWICKPLVETILANLSQFCRGRFSCYVVQRCFDLVSRESNELRMQVLDLIKADVLELCVHEFGNYACQYIFLNCPSEDLVTLYPIFQNKATRIALDKYGSNCIDALLSRVDDINLVRLLMKEMTEDRHMFSLLRNIYGVSVLIRAIKNLSEYKEGKVLATAIISSVSKKKRDGGSLADVVSSKIDKLHPKVSELVKTIQELRIA